MILGALAFVGPRLPRAESATVGGIAALVLVPSAVAVWVSGDVVTDVGWRLVLVALAVAVAVSWAIVGPSPSPSPSPRAAGAGSAIALLALLVADASIVVSGDADALPGSLAAAALLVVVSALLVGVSARGSASFARPTSVAVEVAVAASAAVALVLALVDGGPLTRLTLLVIAVIPTLLAFRPGTARSRRHIAWIGAALAVAALWWFLLDERVTDIEYFSLPVAGLLLLVAGVVGWNSRSARPETPAPVDPATPSGLDVLTAASLAVAILPSTLVTFTGDPARAISVTTAGTALLVLALVVLRDHRALHLRSVAWCAGVVAVGLPAIARATGIAAGTPTTGVADTAVTPSWWAGVVAFILISGALAITRIRRSPLLSDVAASGAAAALGILVSRALIGGTITVVDASPWLIVVCGIAVSAFAVSAFAFGHYGHVAESPRSERAAARPSARVTAIVGLVASLAIAVNALASLEDVEWVTVPLAIAALAAGAVRLVRDRRSGSWITLAPGLLLLLVPSLLYDLGQSTLWRVIALGVLGVLITVAGALWRLQSPLVIGATVTVLHGLAQLWPWISGLYEAGYWWVWAGIGGVLLIAFAARYEQRMRDLRLVSRALRALR
jgi:hypothetical protein